MAKNLPRAIPQSAAQFVPPKPTRRTAKQAAADCKGCDLYRRATQTVFGEGRAHAAVVFVGEQPGDAEDLEGRPFVESPLAPVVMATVHPSSVLRAQTDEERRVAMEKFVADLRSLAKKLSG